MGRIIYKRLKEITSVNWRKFKQLYDDWVWVELDYY